MTASLSACPQDDRPGLRSQLADLAWSIGVHCEIVRQYAELGHDEGLFYALTDAKTCLKAALIVQRDLANANAALEKGGPDDQGR